ncbi:hypothetical protein Fmac_028389 [Flemingia macrophylla]|uniref:Translation initiation factor beta propellor-like domain-containing protein n=1 Tax=Flemingia macrophylla TaxID=520843 RepID=A0ABD1L7D1_9FABA
MALRGKMLGHISSMKVHVRPWGSSYAEADVEFVGISVLPELVTLLEDLSKGIVPFQTISQARGHLSLFFYHFPMNKAKLSCEVLVGVLNQTIVRQHLTQAMQKTSNLDKCHVNHHLGKDFNRQLEFYNVDELETMATNEHFMATDIEWDPTGRYDATSVTLAHDFQDLLTIRKQNCVIQHAIEFDDLK